MAANDPTPQRWYTSRYAQAALVAFVTGLIAALGVYTATMTDGLDTRHTIKVVLTAFLLPFAMLSSVLPKITDIITPTIRLVSNVPITEVAPLATSEREIVTSAPLTTVAVDAPPAIGHRPAQRAPVPETTAPPKRSHHAKVPAVVTPIDVRSDS